MELWNSLPDASPSRPVSWTIPLSAENASALTESVAPSDLYFSALTKFTYFTKEATQTIHHFVQNCSRYIENYCFKHKNLGGPPTGGSAPGPPLGAPPPDPHYRLALPRTPWVAYVFDPHFSLPSVAPAQTSPPNLAVPSIGCVE